VRPPCAPFTHSAFDRPLLERLPSSLRLISLTGRAGAQVDLEAAAERGITVCAGRSLGKSAAELTWALVLAASRHLALEDRRMREGRWQTTLGRMLAGRTLGIFGYGRIGSTIAAYGRVFEMPVLVWGSERSRERALADGHQAASGRESFFGRSDVVSLHLALNPATRGIVTAADLACMKPDALLVNTARAQLIEPGALRAALQAGRPGAAALDVFDVEPLPADDPLLKMDNVLLAPHLGYVSRDNYEVLLGDAFENIVAYSKGKPTGVVTAGG
jgi:D-3-phosphoglycerate dehydrogenase